MWVLNLKQYPMPNKYCLDLLGIVAQVFQGLMVANRPSYQLVQK